MSEERMERKSVTRSQQPKAGPPDCKKSSDAAHKPLPRSVKKREGGNSGNRNEAPRRNLPPARGAAAGRARTHIQRGAVGREESSGLGDTEAEFGSVFVTGSKKQSLNHLLQFVYSPRETLPLRRATPSRPRNTPALHPHHTELFLQASCQFAMRADGQYAAHLLDPDLPVDWELVQHVVMRSEDACECPVCLCKPVAARVTRCGHVYCWPCALHYADVHDRPAPPCPVCAAPLDVAQLKSASLRRSAAAAEGREVVMRLVRRMRNSTLVEPAPERESHHHNATDFPRWQHEVDLPYAKIVTITTDQVLDIIQRERAELAQQILNEIDTSELPYLERALDLLKQKEVEINKQLPISVVPTRSPTPPLVQQLTSENKRHVDWFDVTEDQPERADIDDDAPEQPENGEMAVEIAQVGLEKMRLSEEDRGSALDPEAAEFVVETARGELTEEELLPALSQEDMDNKAKYFYFYQGADGQQVFLDGLNVRVLVASWGGHVAAPRVLRAPLLSVTQLTVTKQSRMHTPCTAHLPLYCPYELVELDLQPPYVTPRALALYAGELEKRARARSRAQREERRRERRAAPSRAPPPPPSPASLQHFPPPQQDPAPPPPPPAEHAHTPSASLSFAKMAGTSGAWRVRSPQASTPVAAPAPAPAPCDDDEASSPPPRTLCLSDAIEAALHAPPPTKHKKKSKQKLLLSTSMQRSQ